MTASKLWTNTIGPTMKKSLTITCNSIAFTISYIKHRRFAGYFCIQKEKWLPLLCSDLFYFENYSHWVWESLDYHNLRKMVCGFITAFHGDLQNCTPGPFQRRGSARSNWWLLSMLLMIGPKWPSPRNDHLWPDQRATWDTFNLESLTAAFLLKKYG